MSAVSTRSVAEFFVLTNDMKSMKMTMTNQKLTITKLTARLEFDDNASLFPDEESVDPPASTNSTNPALSRQKIKRRKTKRNTRH